jgi:hypothetical protein
MRTPRASDPYLDPLRAGVLGDVRQGLLRHPIHRKPSLGAEFACLAGHREPAGDATDFLELRGQVGQALGSGQFVVTQHPIARRASSSPVLPR